MQPVRFFLHQVRLGNPFRQWFRVGKLQVEKDLAPTVGLSHGLHLERFPQLEFLMPVMLHPFLEVPRMQELFHPILDVLLAHHRAQLQVAVHVLLFHPSSCPS